MHRITHNRIQVCKYESESELVCKFSSTPTPARSRSRLQHLFIISLLVKTETEMETELNVLTADSRWFAVYVALITGVASVSG